MVTLWDIIFKCREIEQQVRKHYEEKGQYLIRNIFAEWIENEIFSHQINNEDQKKYFADKFCIDLDNKIHFQILNSGSEDVNKWTEIFKQKKNFTPLAYYNHLAKGIQQELEFVNQLDAAYNIESSTYYQSYGIYTRDISEDVRKVFLEITKLSCELQLFLNNINELYIAMENFSMQNLNPLNINDHQSLLNESILSFNKYFCKFQNLKSNVDENLNKWQRNQALALNGAPVTDNLDDIQTCIENLLSIASHLMNIYNSLHLMVSKYSSCERLILELEQVSFMIEKIKQLIVISAFVVEKQPPQVIKKQSKFETSIRWLIGPQLEIYRSTPKVECIIVSETQAQRFKETYYEMEAKLFPQGELQNNIGKMEYNPNNTNRRFAVNFSMQIKNIERYDKKPTETVCDEKFALLFYTTDIHLDSENVRGLKRFKINAWTLSSPITLTVHPTQESKAWATITWDNAFSDINRVPFQVPKRVKWADFLNALNTKFYGYSGRQLTNDNLHFLFEKFAEVHDNNSQYVSWSKFAKENLFGKTCSFTFWEWFHGIMKLTKDHILKPWQAGCINGFISKTNATEILRQCPEGTFLIRFSESEMGGVTVAYQNNGDTLMLAPWSSKDLQVRSLSDRIYDLSTLQYLYNGPSSYIPKDQAFGQFYSQRGDFAYVAPDGYVMNELRLSIPNIQNIQTTNKFMIQSPNSSDINANPSINMYDPTSLNQIEQPDFSD